jgi:hypothetical protein
MSNRTLGIAALAAAAGAAWYYQSNMGIEKDIPK